MVIAIVTVAVGFSGCGQSERDQVEAKVQQFEQAVLHKDYRTICDQVLAPALLDHLAAGGVTCDQAMQVGLHSVQNPTLSIAQITVRGANATAITLTGARGEPLAIDAIELIKTDSGWRIASLGAGGQERQLHLSAPRR
jgi:hypothetical protein